MKACSICWGRGRFNSRRFFVTKTQIVFIRVHAYHTNYNIVLYDTVNDIRYRLGGKGGGVRIRSIHPSHDSNEYINVVNRYSINDFVPNS